MPAKRCIETKNMCLLFVDYCIFPLCTHFIFELWVYKLVFSLYTQFKFFHHLLLYSVTFMRLPLTVICTAPLQSVR